jgi:hypothetical protein
MRDLKGAGFTGISRIPGRLAASPIASPSLRSFFALDERLHILRRDQSPHDDRMPAASAPSGAPRRTLPSHRRFCRMITRASAFTACSVKTDLDVSMATRVIPLTDGSLFSFDSESWD